MVIGWLLLGAAVAGLGALFNDSDKKKKEDSSTEEFLEYYDMGIKYFNKYLSENKYDDFDTALSAFSRSVELNSDFPDAHYQLGLLRDKINERVVAQDNYFKAGVLFIDSENYDKAILCFTRILKEDSKFVNAYYNLGLAYEGKDDYTNAVAAYNKVIKLDNTNGDAYHQLGNLYAKKELFEDALKMLHFALQFKNDDNVVLFDIAYIYLNKKDYKEALNHFGRIIKNDPNNYEAYIHLGITYSEMEDKRKAIESIDCAIALDINNFRGFYVKGLIYYDFEDYINAILVIQNLIKMEPANLVYQLLLGQIYYDVEDYLLSYEILKKIEKKKKDLEELPEAIQKTKKALVESIHTLCITLNAANKQFECFISEEHGYFAHYPMKLWLASNSSYVDEINKYPWKDLIIDDIDQEIVQEFLRYYQNAESIRNDYNPKFIKSELQRYSSFFNDIEGLVLDIQQRTAIVTDEDNNLVVAGAGSGKTTTIIGKTAYIMDRYNILPEEIVLISFTNRARFALENRMQSTGVQAKTFHKFSKDIIVEAECVQPTIFEDNKFPKLIEKLFNEMLKEPHYLNTVVTYFGQYLKPIKTFHDVENKELHIQYLKSQSIKPFKMVKTVTKGKETFNRETVKSVEECLIANYLLFNNVDYEYEPSYEVSTADIEYRQYKPDFLIKQKGKKVYLEHFALNKKNEIPRYFAKNGESYFDARTRYMEKINWARETHKKNNTILIETYSHEVFDCSIFDKLEVRLKSVGIAVVPKKPEEIWKIINDNAKNDITQFITLLQTYITLMKSNNASVNDIKIRIKNEKHSLSLKRAQVFIELLTPIFEQYQSHLQKINEIDFADMINKATDHIQKGANKTSYRALIIDEFQDISIGRYQLLMAIKSRYPECKMFCVGDDWQSIFRFAGSDNTLFYHFEKYFGVTAISKIETTYRFKTPLIQTTSEFILKNPVQVKKTLRQNGEGKTDHRIVYTEESDNSDSDALAQIFENLIKENKKITTKDIMILGRYNFDIDRIESSKNNIAVKRKASEQLITGDGELSHTADIVEYTSSSGIVLRAEYLTVHKAKGLEADIVIIINCNSGRYGFPSEISDDPLLKYVLSDSDSFENSEERRLFYVALTRAKERVYIIAHENIASKFLSEIDVSNSQRKTGKCPVCQEGNLLKRSGTTKGRKWAFWGCSNYRYGCDYKVWFDDDTI